jgi:acylphosphatase
VTDQTSRQRREVCYRGYVQGVGFRYTVQRIARGYEVEGFVRNLPDGRVELVAEGTAQTLDRFLGQVAESMSQYIHHSDAERCPPTGEYSGFDIHF